MAWGGPAWDVQVEQVFRAEYQRLVPLLVRITGDRTLAEELASEAMYRLSARPALAEDACIEAWLYRTATNLALDALRIRTRRARYEDAAAVENRSVVPTPLDHLLSLERQQAVRTVLAAMKPRSARALLLRNAGFSYAEIAGVLEVEPSAIPSIVMRAAEEFRKQYQNIFRSEP